MRLRGPPPLWGQAFQPALRGMSGDAGQKPGGRQKA
jgi:hypothetical protein